MDMNSPPPCPNTVTIRRNPHRRARATPKTTPQSFNLHEIPPFPHDDVLSAETPKNENPSVSTTLTSPPKPENEKLKVFLRIRPTPSPNQAPKVRAKSAWPQNPTRKNIAEGAKNSKKKSSNLCILVNDSQSVTLSPPLHMQESKRIKAETYGGFSHVFPSDSSQCEVYERMVKPMVEEFLKGRSGMLAALGPSGSGKTHTVFGCPRDPGMVPLALRQIFKDTEPHGKHASRSFHMSIFEIYTERGKAEKLLDLLRDGGEVSMQQSTIKGLQQVIISNAEQAESLIAQAVLKRATAMTNTNSQSSRSQCIINIRDVPQTCKGVVNSKSNSAVLTILDLAGAEREKRTGNQGTRLLESNFINNTLMVFGLCLRSLLEHQRNPKKPLQKHFQNSMLTRYLREYLEGKKRMTLILTAKSGDEDYLDTSYLLRQASPYMQIKYNEAEPSNMVPKKRHYQASSTLDYAKPSPLLEHLKRMRFVSGEHTVQNDEGVVEERNTSKEDASTVCKLDATSCVSFKSEFDIQARSERSHIIMRNFAKVIWSVLKEYNSKQKDAEMEIRSLKESIEYEKKKYLVLETEFNEFKACCTCSEGGKVKVKGGVVDPDLNTINSDDNTLKYEPSVIAFDSDVANASELRGENSCVDNYQIIEFTNNQPNDDFTRHEADFIPSPPQSRGFTTGDNRSSVELDQLHNWEQEETFYAEASSKPRLDQSDEESTLGTSCTQLDSEKTDREVCAASSKLAHLNTLEVEVVSKIPSETFHAHASSEPGTDQSDEESTLGSTRLDFEDFDREVWAASSNPAHQNALEVEVVSRIPCESFHAHASSGSRIDQSGEEPTLGTSCTQLDSEKSDRDVWASSSKPADHNALEVEAVSKIPSESFHAQASSEPRIDQSGEEPALGTSRTQLDSENSDREVWASSSKPGHDTVLEVEAVSKLSRELFVSSSIPKDEILEPSLPKDVLSTKTSDLAGDPLGEMGIRDVSSCKPPKPKRTLMPSSSLLSRDFTFDVVDESEKLKGNRSTRKLATDNIKRTNGSISLLRLLQGKTNLHGH